MRKLTGRRAECGALDRLIEAIRAGESRALVIHGESGVGKTALLEYLAGQASGCRLARAAGVQSEMELPFAGLHQLCAPMLDHAERLPLPQRDALRTVFGLSLGPAPDRFLVGLAVLGLLAETAADRPLLCLVDDYQWLDRASAEVLAFAARRLGAESVALVFATRVPGGELAGLPELAVGGLPEADARALLDSVLVGPVDARVRDQIVTETRGNPLALLELPRGLTAAELAGGFGFPGAIPPSGSIEESFRRRIDALPDRTKRLVLLAAADPAGDPVLVWRAAARLGIGADAAVPADEAGIADFGARLLFRHPLARSAAYRSASDQERQEIHRALADATDGAIDPDRRAWHMAQAASGPDESVAAELERSAGRARARGGLAAAAAFLERAVILTVDPSHRTERALAAARAKIQAGAFNAAQSMMDIAETPPHTELQQAQADLLRAQLTSVTDRGSDAAPLLLKAARRLEPIDAALCRATYLDAMTAAFFAGRLASPGGDALEVARAASAAPRPPDAPRASDLLLDGLAALFTDGYRAGVPILREALRIFGTSMPADEELRWLWLACIAAQHIWDDDAWEALSDRYVRLARSAGALSELPLALSERTYLQLFVGDITVAAALEHEIQAATEATGSNLASYGAMGVAALRGSQPKASTLIEATTKDASRRGEGIGITVAEWADAVLNNSLGRWSEAMTAAQQAASHPDPVMANLAVVELIEAAARSGMTETAADAHRRFAEIADASGTDWALGVEARSRALVTEGQAAEALYREAITRLERTRVRLELARAHLLYGEWLRQQRRRSDAREELHIAVRMLEAMGMEAFAGRADRELGATGARGKAAGSIKTAPVKNELTAQETQIARLARDGLSNPEIGTRLFISARTVQYHLRKIFVKLGITSRSQLDLVLPDSPT